MNIINPKKKESLFIYSQIKSFDFEKCQSHYNTEINHITFITLKFSEFDLML